MPLARTIKQQQQQQAQVQSAPVSIVKKKKVISHPSPSSNSNQQQQLCDETRAQYELLLQCQETSHERQLQTAQLKLQQLLSSHISLVEHEKILFAEGEFHRREREREHQAAAHAHELTQLEAQWWLKWQTREKELRLNWEEEKNLVLDMLLPLELERNDTLRLLKEQEIDQLTWSKELHETNRARELAEVRFGEACKHILTLKACVKRLELKPNRLQAEKQKKAEFYDKWQQKKLELAELKGELSKKIATLESDLAHVRDALADKKERHAALQKEAPELRLQCHQLETEMAELRTTERLSCESRSTERAQFEKELAASQCALASQKTKLQQTRQRADALEQRACTSDIRAQELATKLELLTRVSGEREATWRRQKTELRAKMAQLKSVMRQLQQQQERQHDEQLSGLLFGSSAATIGSF